MITAKEAIELTIANKKSSVSVFNAIQTMAESGYNYATFNVAELANVDEIVKSVTDAGFKTKLSDFHLTINW